MEAPEKVYIDDYGSGFSHGWHTEHSYEKDIEYIRKDTFVEKALYWLEKNFDSYSYPSHLMFDDFREYLDKD